jgi:FkbM family methyltransferase
MVLANVSDPARNGTFVEIGVGTSDYYFVQFAEKGFQTLAVEPLPTKTLLTTCDKYNVPLEISVVAEENGHVPIYLGQYSGPPNVKLSSLNADWWGSSREDREVPSLRFDSLLAKYAIKSVTALKVDVEGSELAIVNQLKFVPKEVLPRLVQFEYGGGGSKHGQLGGWSPKYFGRTCTTLEVLQSLGYEWLLLVDRDLPAVRSVWLPDTNSLGEVFHPLSHVGNAIVCKDGSLRQTVDLADLCRAYVDYPQTLATSLARLGSDQATHSFKWVVPHVIAQQYETKRRPLRVLEYGPGCNTEQFVKSLVCEHLVSVEDNAEWYHRFAPAALSDAAMEVDYHLIEVRSAKDKAYDGGHCWTESEILAYSHYPVKYGSGYFDIVFVDSGDRQDEVTLAGRTYLGWPIRNLCLELAHSLLAPGGVVVLHDFPGPYPGMIRALSKNVQAFKYSEQFEEFGTTVLSHSLDLTCLRAQINQSYRLGPFTRLIARLLNRSGLTWHRSRIANPLMKRLMRLSDPTASHS